MVGAHWSSRQSNRNRNHCWGEGVLPPPPPIHPPVTCTGRAICHPLTGMCMHSANLHAFGQLNHAQPLLSHQYVPLVCTFLGAVLFYMHLWTDGAQWCFAHAPGLLQLLVGYPRGGGILGCRLARYVRSRVVGMLHVGIPNCACTTRLRDFIFRKHQCTCRSLSKQGVSCPPERNEILW